MSVEAKTEREGRGLWILVVSPTIWAVHLLLCYITVAIWCEKFAPAGGSLGSARLAFAIYTIVALAGVAVMIWIGWRMHAEGRRALPHDRDTDRSRRAFVGYATLLLSGLSAVAILYAALVGIFIGSCN